MLPGGANEERESLLRLGGCEAQSPGEPLESVPAERGGETP